MKQVDSKNNDVPKSTRSTPIIMVDTVSIIRRPTISTKSAARMQEATWTNPTAMVGSLPFISPEPPTSKTVRAFGTMTLMPLNCCVIITQKQAKNDRKTCRFVNSFNQLCKTFAIQFHKKI